PAKLAAVEAAYGLDGGSIQRFLATGAPLTPPVEEVASQWRGNEHTDDDLRDNESLSIEPRPEYGPGARRWELTVTFPDDELTAGKVFVRTPRVEILAYLRRQIERIRAQG
ncbi:hypothetical protein, partial [Marinitenerispora sediminis]